MSDSAIATFKDPAIAICILDELPRETLRHLCLTCKLMCSRARPVLYNTVALNFPRAAISACITLADNPHLASLVHVFRLHVAPNSTLAFWEQVAFALQNMTSLTVLHISDVSSANAQLRETFASVLTHVPSSVKLTELTWTSTWDESADDWLATQHSLRSLVIYDAATTYCPPVVLDAILWPSLQFAEVTTLVAPPICSAAPLQTLKIYIDTEAEQHIFLSDILPRLQNSKTLRVLNVWTIRPVHVAHEALALIATALPDMQFVGVLPLPLQDRSAFHAALMCFHTLSALEVDATHFKPPPGLAAQRALAWELSGFCPSLRLFNIWFVYNGMRRRSMFQHDPMRETWSLIDESRRQSGWEGQLQLLGSIEELQSQT